MKKKENMGKRLMALLLSVAMIFSPSVGTTAFAAETGTEQNASILAAAVGFSNVGGWNESIYAELSGINEEDVTEVSYTGAMSGKLTGDDLTYLVRSVGSKVRIDVVGLKPGTYELKVVAGEKTFTKSGITVTAYDRSGFAHFKYTKGVGAYNDDGTLKDNAIVLYVTDENKNDVELSYGGVTVKGIGNILNSVGQAMPATGLTNNGGVPNTNQGIIKKIALADIPLVVRFVGTVSDSGLRAKGSFAAKTPSLIKGLTDYSSLDNGGTKGDNGHMARIQSGKNITLEGIGNDAVIDGWGFHFISEGSNPELGESFEVRNLTFINTPEDAVGMEGQQASKNTSSVISSSVERCWVHHNEFYCPHISDPAESDKSEGDGSVDFKRGQYFTCSYNYFEECHKTNLVGSADYSLQFNLSYHHNWWYMCKARGPLTRNANVHMYNNIWDMQTDYAQNTRADAYIFSEYNMFYACKSPQAVEAGAIKSYNDTFASYIVNKGSMGTVVTDKNEYVPNNCQYRAGNVKYDSFDTDPNLSYISTNDYKLETDMQTLRKTIIAETGTMEANPKTAADVTDSEASVFSRYFKVSGVSLTPGTVNPGKLTNKLPYVFTLGAKSNVTMECATPCVLINAAGECLLQGSGTVVGLEAGTYGIQALAFQPGDPAKGTIVTFKEENITSLTVEAFDPNAHYHKWVEDKSKRVEATCEAAGKAVYTCEAAGCDINTKEEVIAALGHKYATTWTIDKPATKEEEGQKSHHCTRCGAIDPSSITVIGTNDGDDIGGGSTGGGGSTAAGDYAISFNKAGKTAVGSTDFFTLSSANFSDGKGPVTINGESYTDSLKMESNTKVSFSCNEGAELTIIFAAADSGKNIKIDGVAKDIPTDSTLTLTLTEGDHEITRGTNETAVFYVAVANGSVEKVTLTLDYNYDDCPDPIELSVNQGSSYANAVAIVPENFTRNSFDLKGLYLDAECAQEVTYPYVANADATLYADWSFAAPTVVYYAITFNSNGGSDVTTVKIAEDEVYELTEVPTREGYTFAGWFDAPTGGNAVSSVDGSKLSGPVNVYAHWVKSSEAVMSLDCATDLSKGSITEKKTVNGFTIHALPGGVGTAGSENPKYYMTVDSGYLGTNGVLLDDKTIPGNEDGLLKAIEFTAENPGVLTINVAKSSSSGSSTMVLAKKQADGTVAEVSRQDITDGTTFKNKTFTLSEAGTYYFYAVGTKGVRYKKVTVSESIYAIVLNAGEGSISATDLSGKDGEKVTIADATPAKGYKFVGWKLGNGEPFTGEYTIDATAAVKGIITLEAVYEVDPNAKVEYTVSFNSKGGSEVASQTVESGHAAVAPKAPTRDGLYFAGWYTDAACTEKYDFATIVTKDITLYALWTDEKPGNGGNDEEGEGIVIIGLEPVYEFTGAKILPNIAVVDYDVEGGKVLAPKTDYTITYKDNVKVNAVETDENEVGYKLADGAKYATITITGKGNYAGKGTAKNFLIAPKSAEESKVIVPLKGYKLAKIDPVSYNGEKQYPDLKLTDAKKATVTYTYDEATETYISADESQEEIPAIVTVSNNINAGTATILLTGDAVKGKATTLKATFKITPIDLSKAGDKLEITPENGEYNVKGATPESVTVTYDGTTLRNGVDYTVKYGANKAAGSAATITVTGKGNYTKKAPVKNYTINKLELADENIVAVKAFDGMKAGKVTAVVVDNAGNTLKPAQYTIKVYDGEEELAATAVLAKEQEIKVVVTAKDIVNLEGSAESSCIVGVDFSKVKADIKKVSYTNPKNGKVSQVTKTWIYTGSPITLSEDPEESDLVVTMKGVTGNLVQDTDYEIVSYNNNVNKGTATVTLKGKGIYSGYKVVKFKIVSKTMILKDTIGTWEDISDIFSVLFGF